MLKEFYQKFKENNKSNMRIVGAVIHKDESNHYQVHIDYIVFRHSERGLKSKISMYGACQGWVFLLIKTK